MGRPTSAHRGLMIGILRRVGVYEMLCAVCVYWLELLSVGVLKALIHPSVVSCCRMDELA